MHDIPLWFWFSLLITVIHTVDESGGDESIWEFLRIPAVLYFGFQILTVFIGLLQPELLIVLRLADAVVMHGLWNAPGRLTSPLLIADVLVLARFGCV